MSVEITIPSPGESISEVTVGAWMKQTGDWVDKDEIILEIESDKATLEITSPASGVLTASGETGAELAVGEVVGQIDTEAKKPASGDGGDSTPSASATPAAPTAGTPAATGTGNPDAKATPVAKKIAADEGIDLGTLKGSGPAGKITKTDVLEAASAKTKAPSTPAPAAVAAPAASPPAPAPAPIRIPTSNAVPGSREVRRVKMTKLRRRIAERLVESQRTAATLTTFNEVDMTRSMAIRKQYKEAFAEKHGVGLGFMSFFVKAAVQALQNQPIVNASIIEDEIEHHDYMDVGVAVGTDKGLVVPVLRNAEGMSFAEVEARIKEFAVRARAGKLSVDEMTGGTFTVSNGGVYGSMMSTPILNPPQSGILGMHGIKKRAVEDPDNPGTIALRPMMYIAMSYDHRIIDGTEAVTFLKTIKECVEAPERLLLDL